MMFWGLFLTDNNYYVIMADLGASPGKQYVSEKIDEIFKELQNVFGIYDVVLVVGNDNNVWIMTTHWEVCYLYAKNYIWN